MQTSAERKPLHHVLEKPGFELRKFRLVAVQFTPGKPEQRTQMDLRKMFLPHPVTKMTLERVLSEGVSPLSITTGSTGSNFYHGSYHV